MSNLQPNKINKPNKPFENYAKYSGIAFQMGAVIGLAVWGGLKTDAYFALPFPAFTLVFSLLSVIFSMIWLIRSLS